MSGERVSVQTITLEKVRLACEASISRQAIEGMLDSRVTMIEDWMMSRWRAQIDGFIWGKTIERHEIAYPLDWWQAVKKRWAPRWWLNRWPVQERTLTIELKALYPTLKYMVPKHEPRLVLMQNGSSIGGFSDE